MKLIKLLIFPVLIISWTCQGKEPRKEEVQDGRDTSPGQKAYLDKRPEEFPEFIKLADLRAFSGKLATTEDVKEGRAVFEFSSAKDPSHRTLDIGLPFYAFKMDRNNKPVMVGVMQAEILQRDTFLGFRYPDGTYGFCGPGELEYFTGQREKIFRSSK